LLDKPNGLTSLGPGICDPNTCFTCSICSHRSVTVLQRQAYKIKNTILPSVDSVKDLGVMVDHHLKFDIHISLAVRKAMLQSRLILKCFSSRNKDILRDILLKAYITYVRPILEYCSPVWSPHLKNLIHKIESVQKFFTKRLPGLWNLPYPKCLQLLNLHSLEYRRISYDLTLCYQFLNGYCDTALTNCFINCPINLTRDNIHNLYKSC